MKKWTLILLILIIAAGSSFAQENQDKPVKGFKKDKLFTGGSITASFFNGGTALGLSPYFGYSLNKFVDVAASINFNYTAHRDYIEYGDRLRQTVYGPGAFIRLFPVHFLFAEAEYQQNFIKLNYLPANNSNYLPSKNSADANSFLVGGGYTSGRRNGNNTYYYLSVMWDIAGVAQSPYVDGLGRNFPVIRGGINIALFQGRNRQRY